MRFFVTLAALSCLLALGQADVKVTIENEAGQTESYNSYECYRVSRKFNAPNNKIKSVGGAVSYYSDSDCKKGVFLDVAGDGTVFPVKDQIKSFRVTRYD
ncbi:hypothetical protein GGI24_006956 [Coemansia furcata]|nr:hypothetical protein GGI24_006956 [Coemansia furcata]